MHTNEKNIEETLQGALQDAREARPSPELLRATLAKIATPLPTLRYAAGYQRSYFNKTALVLAAAAFIVLAGGAGLVALNTVAPGSTQPIVSMGNPGDTSDAALQSDAAAIDQQLSGLSNDNAHTDQVLDKYQQSQF